MSMKVTTPLMSSYRMAGACVGCGGPATPGVTHKVQYSTEAGKIRTTTTLQFPVCHECADASHQRLIGWVPMTLGWLFGLWPTIAAVFFVIGALVDMDLAGLGFGVAMGAVGLALILGGMWLKERIDTWGMTAEQVERRHVLGRSVRIAKVDKGMVVFEFENPSYALGFSTMNMGQLA